MGRESLNVSSHQDVNFSDSINPPPLLKSDCVYAGHKIHVDKPSPNSPLKDLYIDKTIKTNENSKLGPEPDYSNFNETLRQKRNLGVREDIIELKPQVDEGLETNNLIDSKPTTLFGKARSIANKVIEFVENTETFALLFSKETEAVAHAERAAAGTRKEKILIHDADKADKVYTFTGLVDIFLFATGAVQTVRLIKSIGNEKEEIKELKEKIEKSREKVKIYNDALKDVNEHIVQSKNTTIAKPQLRNQRLLLKEAKHKEVTQLWDLRKQLEETEEKLEKHKSKVPLFSSRLVSLGMKAVSSVSDLLKFLSTKGAIAQTAATAGLSFAAGMILLPIAGVISIGISTYLTYKAVQEYKKINKELAEIDTKLSTLNEGKEDTQKNKLAEFIDNKGKEPEISFKERVVKTTKLAESLNLEMKRDQLIERQRQVVLNIASQTVMIGASAILTATPFSGPASPYLLGGAIATLLVSTGIGVYQHFSAKSAQRKFEEEYKNEKLHPNDVLQLSADLANLIKSDPNAAKKIEILLELNAKDKQAMKEHPVEFFRRHFEPLTQKLDK